MESVKKSITSKIIHRLSKGAYGRYKLRQAAQQNPCRIVLGARGCRQEGWTTTEYEVLNPLEPGHWTTYFKLNSIDAMISEHVWESLSWEDGVEAARNCFDFLKPGGRLRVAVPDGNHPSKDYIDWVKPNGVGPGCDDRKTLYDYRSFRRLFESAGFTVNLLEYFDEHGHFHFRDWRPVDGMIHCSRLFDKRNLGGRLIYTSIILDAIKPASAVKPASSQKSVASSAA